MYKVVDLLGNVSSGGTTLYTVPASRVANINCLRFNNPSGASFDIELRKVIGGNEVLLYKLNLDEGDFVEDSLTIPLSAGTSLYAVSSNDDVTFTLNGNEMQIDGGQTEILS